MSDTKKHMLMFHLFQFLYPEILNLIYVCAIPHQGHYISVDILKLIFSFELI